MESSLQKVLLVEDDRTLNQLLVEELGELGIELRSFHSAEEASMTIKSWQPHLVVSDVRLPGKDGLGLLKDCRALPRQPRFLLITAFGSIPQAVEALKAGADDFLTKPLDLDHFLERTRFLLKSNKRASDDRTVFHGMLGKSELMQTVFDEVRVIARATGPVIVQGESGSGKEMVARAIHQESYRSEGPFVAINCAGTPKELLESEFFGHTSGAFTGAKGGRRGLFEEADGGSLFLDEIAEMPLELQAKLLRFLQDGRVRPLGANEEREVDVRVIAATNKNLKEEVEKGRFREDLFFRLETFVLEVPPLRKRKEDLEPLAQFFFQEHDVDLPDEAIFEKLRSYSFPGNVRELKNIIDHVVAYANGDVPRVCYLPQKVYEVATSHRDESSTEDDLIPLEELQQRHIQRVLERMKGNKKKAADALGISRKTLYRRLDSDS